MVSIHRAKLAVEGAAVDAVTAAIHEPTRRYRPAVLLLPGAGGDLDGDGLVALADTLAGLRHPVVRANLPHHEAGSAAPRADRSVPASLQLFEAARQELGGRLPWVAGGKSYGGRVASMAAAEGMDVSGLIFYGYPLHPPGKLDRLRVDHWPRVRVPCLFLQGDRDPFCDLSLLERCVRKLPRRATVHVVAGGDHSLRVTAAASPTGSPSPPAATLASLRDVLQSWIASLAA